ncbi:MAG: molybdopterin-dependent oxidoreductase [Candidatus Eisenbacteria bacterium]|nr:molybdopterin-dependent oxidoreductase [Candidatus Eisenbacteria bacterium]
MSTENIITIDGREVEFTPGETILDVARRNAIFIPTLCHLPGAPPTGACRICVVEVEKARAFAAACTTPAAKGMVVHTHSQKIVKARRGILGLLLASGNHNCAVQRKGGGEWSTFQHEVQEYDGSEELCEVYGDCQLQSLAYKYQADSSLFQRSRDPYPLEMASPLIVRDFSRCILCGRCVQACNEIQVNNAISHGFRGAKAKIVAMGDDTYERSDCVFCGECLQSCPVGALVEKKSRFQIRPWEARHVRTTCPYCSVGCQLDLHIKDDRVMKVTGVPDAEPNRGRLCVKGRFGFDFVSSEKRLTHPQIREDGKLRNASWDEALDRVARQIQSTREAHGADAIAALSGAKATNESLYLLQKLFRTAVGTNNLAAPFAASGLSQSLADLEHARRILLIGSDVTEENPVAGTSLKRAAKAGAELIVIDSQRTKIASFATHFLQAREGTENVLVAGLIRELLERRPSQDAEAIRAAVDEFPREKVQELTGVGAEQLDAVLEILAGEDPLMLLYGAKVCAWAQTYHNLQHVLGNLDRAGGGLGCLSDLNNSQGACDLGVHPELLPGYRPVGDEAARGAVAQAWEASLSATPGKTAGEILQGLGGEIRLLYCAGEDPALADPLVPGVRAALEKADFVVVEEFVANETLAYADVVLPCAAWSEEDGTFTNCERRVSRARRVSEPAGAARPSIWIYQKLAQRLGQSWPERTAQQIWDEEITQVVPPLAGIRYARIARDGLQWPVETGEAQGTPRLAGAQPMLCRAAWSTFNYHHRTLLELCDGLLETLPRSGGLGTRVPPSNTEEVTRAFVAFLKEEEKLDTREEIDAVLAQYRDTRGGLIPVLQKVQEMLGFLPVSVQNYIAWGLNVPAADVFGVVSFYSFFTMVPRGRFIVRVCLGTACFVKGSGKLLEILLRHLKINVGETTPDREYSVEAVRCVGACGLAPVVVVNENTHGSVEPDELVEIIENYRGAMTEA